MYKTMNGSLTVSVVMSVFNAQKYLEEAIESVLDQSFVDFEFIVINDGSTDDSLKLIQDFKKTNARIFLISRENKGLIASLNEGIKAAKGKYIIRMDADDISQPGRIEALVRFMESNPDVDICGSFVESFGDGINTSIWKFPEEHEAMRVRTIFTVPLCHGSAIFKANLFQEKGVQFDNAFPHAEDYELFARLSNVAQFGMLPKPLYKVRYVESSVSRVADKDEESRKKVLSKIFTRITKELELDLAPSECHLHYMLTTSERLKSKKLKLVEVRKYLTKLKNANDKVGFFDKYYFKRFLARKYITVLFYQFVNYRVFSFRSLYSSFVIRGVWDALMKRPV
jgi:glycosyltransferase involved in cell wall biosynthesis